MSFIKFSSIDYFCIFFFYLLICCFSLCNYSLCYYFSPPTLFFIDFLLVSSFFSLIFYKHSFYYFSPLSIFFMYFIFLLAHVSPFFFFSLSPCPLLSFSPLLSFYFFSRILFFLRPLPLPRVRVDKGRWVRERVEEVIETV